MVIDFNNIGSGPNSSQRAKDGAGATSRAGGKGVEPDARQPLSQGDNVSLSDKAKSLKELEASIISQPDVNKEKVEKIKAAIAEGSYSVNSEKVAQKMLDFDSSVF
jgi:negative regulator of flagellin synthesis FlgM